MNNGSHLKIAFDLDGVLVDTNSIALGILEDYAKREIVPCRYYFASDYNIPDSEVYEAYVKAFQLQTSIHVLPGAKRLVSALWGLSGDAITIITSRSYRHAEETFKICEKVCEKVPFRLTMVGENGNKARYLNKFDYFVEDRRATAIKLSENNVCEVFLIDTTYNQGTDHPNIHRINGLDDLFAHDLKNFVG